MNLRELIWLRRFGFLGGSGLCLVCHSQTVQMESYFQLRCLPNQLYLGEHISNWTVGCANCNKLYTPEKGALQLMLEKGYLRQSDYQQLIANIQAIVQQKCSYHVGNGYYCQNYQLDAEKTLCRQHWNAQHMHMDMT